MLINGTPCFDLRLTNRIKFISFIFWYLLPLTSGYNQEVRAVYEKITENFNHKNYYTTLNLCREVIRICETSPEPECWYTNIMKEIYRYKGLADFEIYKEELKKNA